jgi:hypothetical protein
MQSKTTFWLTAGGQLPFALWHRRSIFNNILIRQMIVPLVLENCIPPNFWTTLLRGNLSESKFSKLD